MNFEDRILKTISEARRRNIDREPIPRPGEISPQEITRKAMEAARRLAQRQKEREHIAPGLPGPEEEPLPPGREEVAVGPIPKRPEQELEDLRPTVERPEDEEEALELLRRLEAESGASFEIDRPERPGLSKPSQEPPSKPIVIRRKRKFPRSST